MFYECNLLAYSLEKAGGKATDGTQRILEKWLEELHERTPFFIEFENDDRTGTMPGISQLN